MSEYNGWTNYHTWKMYVELSNVEAAYRMLSSFTSIDELTEHLENIGGYPDDVNYREVAEAFLEES